MEIKTKKKMGVKVATVEKREIKEINDRKTQNIIRKLVLSI